MSYRINSFISSEKSVVSYEKRLSICIKSNGFSFSLCDLNDEILAIGDVECNILDSMGGLMNTVKSVFAEVHIQPYGLKESELIVNSRQFVWIPQHLFDESRTRDYLEALCKINTGYGVFTDFNDSVKAYLIFSADNNLTSAFKISLPGLKVRCQHSKMANSTIIDNSEFKSLLLVNVREKESDYAVFCNKKLQISNTFDCANFDETLYYAINLTKQFHLEDAMMYTAVCGNVDRESFARMRSFLPNVSLYTGKQHTISTPEIQHVPLYKHAIELS